MLISVFILRNISVYIIEHTYLRLYYRKRKLSFFVYIIIRLLGSLYGCYSLFIFSSDIFIYITYIFITMIQTHNSSTPAVAWGLCSDTDKFFMRTIARSGFTSIPEGCPSYLTDFSAYKAIESPPILLVSWWVLAVPKVSTKARARNGQLSVVERVMSVHNSTPIEAKFVLRYSHHIANDDAVRRHRLLCIQKWGNLCDYIHREWGISVPKVFVPWVIPYAVDGQVTAVSGEGRVFIPKVFLQGSSCHWLQHRYKDRDAKSVYDDRISKKDGSIITALIETYHIAYRSDRALLLRYLRSAFTDDYRLSLCTSALPTDFLDSVRKFKTIYGVPKL